VLVEALWIAAGAGRLTNDDVHAPLALRAIFPGEGPECDLRECGRMLIGATEPAMPTEPKKPLIVISYAHADEPEEPAEGEVRFCRS
jgi:hypothetical protein